MKKFISILIGLFAILTIQAQQIRLDKAYSNTCVVQQHIDVGVTIQPVYNYSYSYLPPNFSNHSYLSGTVINTQYVATTYNPVIYTSYNDYRRGVGLINIDVNNRNISYITNSSYDNKYRNIQRYYCYN